MDENQEYKSIKLTNLLVNLENYRFKPVSSQVDAIEKMIADQGDKLYHLANDIIDHGLNPCDLIAVSPSSVTNCYTVLEGNRRISALKILNNPMLIGEKNRKLQKNFLKLKEENKDKLIKAVDCRIFLNPTDADLWIKRKHATGLNGIGTEAWSPQQRQRFEAHTGGKTSAVLQVLEFVKSSDSVSDTLKSQLGDINITNFSRLLADPYVRNKLGLTEEKGIVSSIVDPDEISKGLSTVIQSILKPDFAVNQIYLKAQRKSFIDSFNENEMPDFEKNTSSSWRLETFVESIGNEKMAPNKNDIKIKASAAKTALISQDIHLKIPSSDIKINNIYKELQHLPVKKYPNAVAVMIRVFLELSINAYILAHDDLHKNVESGHKDKLGQKVQAVITHLGDKLSRDQQKCISNEMSDKTSICSIESLNAYIHNELLSPKADNLYLGWSHIQPLIETLWNNISMK